MSGACAAVSPLTAGGEGWGVGGGVWGVGGVPGCRVPVRQCPRSRRGVRGGGWGVGGG